MFVVVWHDVAPEASFLPPFSTTPAPPSGCCQRHEDGLWPQDIMAGLPRLTSLPLSSVLTAGGEGARYQDEHGII